MNVSKEKYRTLFDNIVQGIFYQRYDGVLTDVNPAALEMFGLTRDEFLGKTSYDKHCRVIHEDGSTFSVEDHPSMVALKTGEPVKNVTAGVYNARKKDYVWLNINAIPIFLSGEQKPYQVLVTINDITERRNVEKTLQDNEEKFRTIFTESPIGIELYDANGFLYQANKASLDMFGISDINEVLGFNLFEGTTLTEKNKEKLRKGKPVSYFASFDFDRVKELNQYETTRTERAELFYVITPLFKLSRKNISGYLVQIQDMTERKRAEEALKFSEERYKLLSDLTFEGILVHKDGIAIEANLSFCKMFGYQKEEIIGRNVIEMLVTEEFRELGYKNARRGYSGRYEIICRRCDGSTFWVEIIGKPFTLNDKTIRVIAIRDITESKQAREVLKINEERFRQMFNHMSSGVAVYEAIDDGKDFVFKEFNPAAERSTMTKRNDILGERVSHVFPDVKRFGLFDVFQRVWRTRIPEYKHESLYHDKRLTFWAENYVYKLPSGEIVAIFDDITERKSAEDKIRELNAELEQRVLNRTAELEAVNKELETFAYSVSHDLRAPLRGIDGWSLALMDDYTDLFDETAKTYLNRVRNETQRMSQLIDDLLQLSRVTRSEMSRSKVDLTDLSLRIIDRLRQSEPQRHVEFTVHPEMIVTGDTRLLEIAIYNLLENSWKFTRVHSVAHIEFGITLTNGKKVYFIQDDGIGFDMTYATKLFGAFQRLHKSSEFPGTGIGLATVQRIIHRHGGRIWAESQPDKGTTFYFTFNHL